MRLRLEKAKELKAHGSELKGRPSSKPSGPSGETDPEKMTLIVPRNPIYKKNTLAAPEKPGAKFRKRQLHKSWLPTHVWHAKRAHMTAPKEPFWRFAIPLAPTDKCYRATHRAGSSSGCVAWDTSYLSTIALEGVEHSLIGLLRAVGVEEAALAGEKHTRWREGTRSWVGWMRERDGDQRWITNVTICWCPAENVTTNAVPHKKEAAGHNEDRKRDKETVGREDEEVLDMEDGEEKETMQSEQMSQKRRKRLAKRKILLRMHPASFLQVWEELLKDAKIQRPPPSIEDLRFQVGSIQIVGPSAMEALAGVLHPQAPPSVSDASTPDISATLSMLALINNTSSLPYNAIIPLSIHDPRLFHPPRTVDGNFNSSTNEMLTDLLSKWPFDNPSSTTSIYDFKDRQRASQLPSQKSINRRKGDAPSGSYAKLVSTDPHIPALLLASCPLLDRKQQGTLTLLLPWKCVLPTWYALMHYPLSIGGNPRFGGLDQTRQISFERGEPWFPGDFPGTKAGWGWELRERTRRKEEWDGRPRGRRIEWESVDLGLGRKGEVGIGWGCDWERLFESEITSQTSSGEQGQHPAAQAAETRHKTSPEDFPTNEANMPPFQIHQIPILSFSPSTSIHPRALAPVQLTVLHRGRPEPCARIYRLPTSNPSLLQKWLTLATLSSPTAAKASSLKPSHISASQRSLLSKKDLPLHDRMRLMAQSLLKEPPALLEDNGDGTQSKIQGDADEACHLPCPDPQDLIGFVTTANYDMGKGKAAAIGNIAVVKVLGLPPVSSTEGGEQEEREVERQEKAKQVMMMIKLRKEGGLCIVRNAGQSVARLARWRFCG